MKLICPICRQELVLRDRSYACASGHSFDRAREGYVNLLLGQPGPTVGDSREMLAARRAFLGAGHYDILSDALNERIGAHLKQRPRAAILDVGCGEGFYLRRLRTALAALLPETRLELAGTDVSREAVRLAARGCPGAGFFVADAWKLLPVADASVDALLSVFSPRNRAEFARVLAPDGLLLVAIPAPEHLHELGVLPGFLSVPEDKRDTLVEQLAGRFRLLDELPVSARLELGAADLLHLVGMTPSARHLSTATVSALGAAGTAPVTAAFRVLAFAREHPHP